MGSFKPRLAKNRSRKRGGKPANKITIARSAPASTICSPRRYFLRSMASPQNTGVGEFRPPQNTLPPNRVKRSWSDEEDALLIEVLLELHDTGKYKADRGFKPGIYSAAEKELERRKPGCGIRIDPHIYSRVKILKSHYSIVSDMLNGNTSGFGWDPLRMCVTAEDDVWASYLQSHKHAAQFRGKTFKYYDELTILFGVDRASGNATTTHHRVPTNDTASVDMNNPENGHDTMASQSVADIGSPIASNSTLSAGRKRKAFANAEVLAETIKETSDRLESSMVTVGKQIFDALSNVSLTAKREMALEALISMSGLTEAELIAAHQMFSDRPLDIDLFLRLSPEARLGWIHRITRG